MFDQHDPAAQSDTAPAAVAATAGALAVSCVDTAHTSVAVAAAMPVDGLDGPQLRALTLQLEQLRRLLDATEHHALAELDRRRHTDLRLGAATSKWLAHGAHLPAGVARSRLALAKRLTDDPALHPVAAALDAGRIGTDHARVLTGALNERNTHALTPVLDDLIDASQAMVFDVWKRHVEHLADMADPDGTHNPDRDLLANTLTLSPSNDFMLLRGELVGEHAICVADVLNAIADDLFHQHTRDAAASNGALRVPPRSTLMALALEEVCRRALATDASSTKKPQVEATLVIHASRNGDHLDIWAVHHHLLGPIPAAQLPTFLCDATFCAVILDTLGLPTDLGRDHRHPTPAQRRALIARDGCCTFPGCDAHIGWLDAHHIRYWHRGGATDLPNMVLLCRRHHRVAHRQGWTLTLSHDGWTRWTTPDGHTFWGQRHHRQRAGPEPA
jgi:hypothetical protein